MTYDIAVDTTNATYPSGDYWWWYPHDTSPTTYTYWTTSTNTVYLYQLICPRCKTTNWGEVDKVVVCKGKKCGANLKAVSQQVDYEIPVG